MMHHQEITKLMSVLFSLQVGQTLHLAPLGRIGSILGSGKPLQHTCMMQKLLLVYAQQK